MKPIDKQMSKLEDEKKRLREKERLLKKMEKKSARDMLCELGQLFVKAKVSHLDHEILLGALLEINDRSADAKFLEECLKTCKLHFQENSSKEHTAIVVSFENPPSQEIREKLKEIKFKWNSFRCEYYGFGNEDILNELLKNQSCKVEKVNASR